MMVMTSLHSITGVGGGAPSIVILILLLGLIPKQATIVGFACIFGAALGYVIDRMRNEV